MVVVKRLLPTLILLCVFLGPSPALRAGELQDGFAAFRAKDYAAALETFRPLAEGGDARARFMMGVMYENGYGVARDLGLAVRWYRLAAEAGIASAQYNLGIFYQRGTGVAADPGEAARWHARAAAQGHAAAQNNLGALYFTGNGVARDPVEAWKWFRLAADRLSGAARKAALRNLEQVEKTLSPDEIEEARRRVAAWKPRRSSD